MNDHVALADFPVRPPLREGESLASWCWRIYLANGHDVPPGVRSATRKFRAEQEMDVDHVLASLFGIETLVSFRVRESRLLDRWDTQCAPGWYVWAPAPRFCPLCVAESGCHLLSWDLPLVSACAVHGCQLRDRCHVCDRKLSWVTLRQGWQCVCGARVQEAAARQSPQFAVRLSRILCAASDAQVTRAVRLCSTPKQPTTQDYRTRDVYEVLWWLLKMRRALTDWRHYPLPGSWPMVPRKGARMAPGSWEIAVMAGLPSTVVIKARYALRWFFRNDRATLVDLDRVTCWHDAEKLMDELDGHRNPLAGLIREAIERVRKEAGASIPGQTGTLFNPRLTAVQRRKRVIELDMWWRRFSADIPGLDPRDRLDQSCNLFGHLYPWYGMDPQVAMALMNVFFEAARCEMPTMAFGALARRWQLPIELRKPRDVMAHLGGYLAGLHKGELLFVLALAVSALNQYGDQEPGWPT